MPSHFFHDFSTIFFGHSITLRRQVQRLTVARSLQIGVHLVDEIVVTLAAFSCRQQMPPVKYPVPDVHADGRAERAKVETFNAIRARSLRSMNVETSSCSEVSWPHPA